MKLKLINILQLQDSFKSPFNFHFNGKKYIYYPIGIIISIFINLSVLILLITLLHELIYHSQPNVNYSEFHTSMTKNLTLNKELLFTIALRDQNYNVINDPSIGYLSAKYERTFTVNGKFKIEIIDLNLMNCSNVYHIFKKFGVDDKFNSTGLIDYNCYNYSEPIIIGGKYGTNFYANLDFSIKKCKNSSNSNIICKSEDEINKSMQNGWLQITYISSFVDLNNYSHPIQYITEDTYFNIDVSLNKQRYIYFSTLEMYSENNIVFSNRKKEISTKHDLTNTDITRSIDNQTLGSIMVCPSFNRQKYYRSYIKIQEIGASVGGIYSLLKVFACILFSFHKNKYIEMQIINNLFTFGNDKHINLKKSLFKFETFNFSNVKISSINKNMKYIYGSGVFLSKSCKEVDSLKNLNNTLNFSKSIINKNNSQKNKIYFYKIDLGFINSIKLLFCFCKHKRTFLLKDYNVIIDELSKYIDYIKVSKLLMDIEKIKAILNNHKFYSEQWRSGKKILFVNKSRNENESKFNLNLGNSKLFRNQGGY